MQYRRIETATDVAKTNELLDLQGEWSNFIVLHNDVDFEYQINSETTDVLYSKEIQGFEGDEGRFRKLFVSHSALAGGKIVVLVYN
ncbi:hypothetical protein FZC84_21235 [Rossellomorea vietnamensis]|uniref:Uncharacterized protein n=1 Tax=Rossellomorea vietnamensis TaxID=218284 RepID=A0A5D4M2W8_9BACI|nr:hypothetical protein [Rossellomorea vietnamensis]TYR95718.1 hypothetical protein FZC84_21235 [Rossellomorea vietnamensis]